MRPKTNVLAKLEKRYGKQGVNYEHTYLSHAYGTYSTSGWIDIKNFKKKFPKDRFNVKWKK